MELVLANHCAICHNSSGLGSLDLSTFAAAMHGGQDGPVIVPGDPEHSLIVQKLAGGTHPGKLIDAQINALKAWITAGAPEQ
jgi:hypothetical protein